MTFPHPLPLPTLTHSSQEPLTTLLHTSVSSRKIPATFFGLTNASEEIYFACEGEKVFGEPEGGVIDEDTTLQMFSSSKLVTTVATLHLLTNPPTSHPSLSLKSLDDPALITEVLPECAALRVFKGYKTSTGKEGGGNAGEGEEVWEDVEKGREVTMRGLLSHTSGTTYTFNNPDVLRYAQEQSIPSMLSPHSTLSSILYPLIRQPQTGWNYSVGLDWAGVLIERLSGLRLEEYFKKFIFDPLGMKSTTFIPREDVKERMMRLTYDTGDGVVKAFPHNFKGTPLERNDDPTKVGFHSGGGGLFGTAKDYLSFLRAVLASSPSNPSPTPKPLLTAESFLELFKDCVPPSDPSDPSSGKAGLLKAMEGQSYHGANLLEDKTGARVGHSVGLCLNLVDSEVGRKAGSGCWDGAAKTQYWLDPTMGIAGICFTNIMAQNPHEFMRVYNRFERAVYDELDKASAGQE